MLHDKKQVKDRNISYKLKGRFLPALFVSFFSIRSLKQ